MLMSILHPTFAFKPNKSYVPDIGLHGIRMLNSVTRF